MVLFSAQVGLANGWSREHITIVAPLIKIARVTVAYLVRKNIVMSNILSMVIVQLRLELPPPTTVYIYALSVLHLYRVQVPTTSCGATLILRSLHRDRSNILPFPVNYMALKATLILVMYRSRGFTAMWVRAFNAIRSPPMVQVELIFSRANYWLVAVKIYLLSWLISLVQGLWFPAKKQFGAKTTISTMTMAHCYFGSRFIKQS